ncbi:MAG: pantetheine-phosphate adenylyltransferase [Candidatus Omnitrophica bacterium]|nr:pantetheine-phosphate adenylyltransferase [Candidatus Omnitrophota bacterium]
MNKAAYLGTFDPITYGHIDLIERASKVYDKLLIGVAEDSGEKKSFFTIDERVSMLKEAVKHLPDVDVEHFGGLAVNYVKKKGIYVIIRGLRMISDFEYEFQMALTNRKLDSEIETVFLMPNESYSYISSRLIKEAASLGADVSDFVPGFVKEALSKKIKNIK